MSNEAPRGNSSSHLAAAPSVPQSGARASSISAYVLVVVGPTLAWLVWISGGGAKASDARHVLWFGSVAIAVLLAGALAPRTATHLVALSVIAFVATMTTLFLWWSAADSSGLFVIGLVLAAPAVAVAAPVLLLVGHLRPRPARSRQE